ncbi:MAG TPA: SUMF1/EgtB/PvdO family nonheme iron enzyme, partial [Pyrinomonadaceae bacterium]|nr:SUMF1/EgtB/PvdO family nonheme iron enzyme [Pyrinomonadaceae bacterium]
MQKRNPFILIVITLFLGLSLLVINNYPQVKSFTLEQITNAVRAVKAKRITARTLINDIRKQKVDFTLNKDDEAFLRAEGATQEIIKAILDNGPGGGGITPPLNTPFTIVEIYDKLKENKSPEAQKTLIEQIQKRKVTDKLDPDTQSFLIQDGATIELIDAISKNPAVGDSNSANPTDPKQPPTTPFFTNSIGMEFMLAPKGSFLMGSNLVEDEQPIRKVTFAKEFLIGRYEVTQGEWEALMGNAVDWLTAKKNLLNANQTDPLKKIDFN